MLSWQGRNFESVISYRFTAFKTPLSNITFLSHCAKSSIDTNVNFYRWRINT